MWYSFGLGFAQINTKVRNGPRSIYEAMANLYPFSGNVNYEDSLFKLPVSYPRTVNAVNASAKKSINSCDGKNFIALGGEHFISYSILRALSSHFKRFSVVHFDAHLDMQDQDPDPEGRSGHYTRATWARRAFEECSINKWVCIGIRDFGIEEKVFAKRNGIDVFSPEQVSAAKKTVSMLKGPVYISVDIDCLDPSIAPSVSVPVPQGLSMHDLLSTLKLVEPVAFDVVELASKTDKHDRTAMAGAYIIREYLSRLVEK